MSKVPYQPLDRSRREIRLVILEDLDDVGSGSNPENLPLKCELITTSLDLYKEPLRNYPAYCVNHLRNALARAFLKDEPYSKEFYALSYVWGDPAATCGIEINGTVAKIGANLYAALYSIQKNTKFRVIWADALCIDQSDDEEKSWQVQQMAAIYSRARATISWLGSPSDDSDLALETLTELDKRMSQFPWNKLESTEGFFRSMREATEGGPPVQKNVLRLARDSVRWNAIANVCARPYWSRLWIFQEMACARDKYFICGDLVAKNITRPISLLVAWQAANQEIHGELLSSHCLSMVNSIQTFTFHSDFPFDTPFYIRTGVLWEMLMKLSTLNATEPRDKIYALLGVATDREQLGIVPDYSKALDLIFRETACTLLREGSLGILLSAGLQDKTLQLPSWVPDWSAKFDAEWGRMFRADGGQSQRSSTLKAIQQLSDHVTLDGYVVGRIQQICDACPATTLGSLDVESDNPTFGDWLGQVEMAILPTSGKGSDGGKSWGKYNTPEVSIMELLATSGGSRPVWSLSPNPYLKVYKALKSARTLRSLVLDLTDDHSPNQDPGFASRVRRVQDNLEGGSRPYRTDSGFMGLTWKDKGSLGDVVVIIPGVSRPFVLRRLDATGQASSCYQLAAVTYIQGIADGKFFKGESIQKLQELTIY